MIITKVKINDYDEIVNLYRQLYNAEKIFDNNLIDNYQVDEKEERKIKKKN